MLSCGTLIENLLLGWCDPLLKCEYSWMQITQAFKRPILVFLKSILISLWSLVFKLQQVLLDSMQNNIFSNCLILDSRPQFYEAYRGNKTAVLMYFFTVLQNLSLMRRMSENLAIEKAREQAVSFVHF